MSNFSRSLFFEGEATVETTISPGQKGRVRFHASSWYAVCEQDITLHPGELVRVTGNRNITLKVETIEKIEFSSES